MTQTESVLYMLRTRAGGITPADALKEVGCMRLAARIDDLKREGYGIDSAIVEVQTRDGTTHVARYRLLSERQK